VPEIGPVLAKWIHEFSALRGRAFGHLEYAIMDALWNHGPKTVRELRPFFPRAAYTTLMTTLDRLYKKGLLHRKQVGYPNVYWPVLSRQELQTAIAARLATAVAAKNG
jgi:BlaI family transcriptional regulator, penicillinase repressor